MATLLLNAKQPVRVAAFLAALGLTGCPATIPTPVESQPPLVFSDSFEREQPPPPAPPPYPVMLGIDVLADQGFGLLAGRRTGLLTHDAAAGRSGETTWSILHRAPQVKLVALFAPEHGLDGKTAASKSTGNFTHRPTGLPVYSFYGDAVYSTGPVLKQLDVLVVDLQDIGSRTYTFVSAMRDALRMCAENGTEIVVLDRPNPLGGVKVDGPMLDPEWASYVGTFPVPYVHGLTIGELARLALGTPGVVKLDDAARARAHLTVVPMRGWNRAMRWPETGLKWRVTSPYVDDFAAVEGYPMTGLGCLLGGWTHGVGRGRPFRGLAFRGKTADQLVAELRGLKIPGLDFQKVELLNAEGKMVQGTVVEVTDWNELRPTELNFHLMRLACEWTRVNPFRAASVAEMRKVNVHVGSTAFWEALVRDGRQVDVRAFVDRWAEESRQFRERSRTFWLYPEPGPPETATGTTNSLRR